MLCCGLWTVTPSAGLASARYQGSGTPPRLRSENQYQGLPYLHERGNEDLLERVLNANTLVRFSAHTLDKAIRLGIATLSENPLNSYYWMFKEIDALCNLPEVDDFEYMGCSLGAPEPRSSGYALTSRNSAPSGASVDTPTTRRSGTGSPIRPGMVGCTLPQKKRSSPQKWPSCVLCSCQPGQSRRVAPVCGSHDGLRARARFDDVTFSSKCPQSCCGRKPWQA